MHWYSFSHYGGIKRQRKNTFSLIGGLMKSKNKSHSETIKKFLGKGQNSWKGRKWPWKCCLLIMSGVNVQMQSNQDFKRGIKHYAPWSDFCGSSLIWAISKKWIQFLECSLSHEYFGSLAMGLHTNFARDPKYSWFHEHSKNWIDCLYLHYIINIWYIFLF